MTVLRCQLGSSVNRSQTHGRGSPVSTPVSRSPFSAPLSQKSRALHFARVQQYAAARQAFQSLLAESPDDVKAWISWAQVRFLCCVHQQPRAAWHDGRVIVQSVGSVTQHTVPDHSSCVPGLPHCRFSNHSKA